MHGGSGGDDTATEKIEKTGLAEYAWLGVS